MTPLRALDRNLVEWLQNIYLWIWDRTGIYIGSLMFAAYVGDHICWAPLKPSNFFFMACAGVVCGQRYFAQQKDLRRLNDLQRTWRDLGVRFYFSVFGFVMLAGDIVALNVWHFLSDTSMLLWSYLACVQIRPRAPKEFLPHLELRRAAA